MSTLTEAIRDTLRELFLPVIAATRYDSSWRGLLYSLGHTEQVASDPGLHSALEQTATVIEGISGIDAETLLSWDGLQHVIEIGADANTAVRAFRQAANDPALADRIADLGEELIEQLVAQYLRNNHRVLFRIFSALTIITPAEFAPVEPAQFDGSEIIRLPWRRTRFRFERIHDLISAPSRMLLESYFPSNLARAVDAHQSAALLFPQLGALADSLHLWWRSDIVSASSAPLPEPPPPDDPALELDHFAGAEDVQLELDVPIQPPPDLTAYYTSTIPRLLFALPRSDGGADPHFAVALLLSSAQHPDGVIGLIVTPVGSFNSTELRGSWRITITSNGQIPAFVAGPNGISLAPSSGLTEGSVRIFLERVPEPGTSGPAFMWGSPQGTRLEIGNLKLSADLSLNPEKCVASIGIEASSGALVLASADGDSFLSSVLPSDGIRAEFDLGLAWSNAHGVTLRGSAGLDATLPIGISIAGVISVPTIYLGLHADNSSIAAEISASLGVSIGPIRAFVDRVGIEGTVTFPSTGGNLGVVDFDMGFKPPSGLGLVIDSLAVVGGGYMNFDSQKGEYSGMLQLAIVDKISVTAFGLLSTKLPDIAPGYSFLILISTEFAPIQLGLGFTLNGVGGLIAMHRRLDVEALRAGMLAGDVDDVLYPRDPIGDAPRIISELTALFPPAKDRFVFAPTALIGWGTPTIVRAELGIVFEPPSPLRVTLLGLISSTLPTEDLAIVEIHVAVLGKIDFAQLRIAIDAKLYDSNIAGYALTGDMAARLTWGLPPSIVVALGGLNPHFEPPADFPSLDRLTLVLGSGDNPKLTCQAYFAMTPNTLQFGVRAELYAAAAGFNIRGWVNFDCLIQQFPFSYRADMEGDVALRRGDHVLASVHLEASITGPLPYHVWGKASVSLWLFSATVSFDVTFGLRLPLPLPSVNPWPLLQAAIEDLRNWSTALPAGAVRAVTLRTSTGARAPILMDPGGAATLRQTVVPLNRKITRFAGGKPEGPDRYTVAFVAMNTLSQTDFAAVTEYFAAAQFDDLTDTDKLSRPSFERMDAGMSVGADAIATGSSVGAKLQYETIILDTSWQARSGPRYTLAQDVQLLMLEQGASVRSPLKTTGLNKFTSTAPSKVSMGDELFAIVNTLDARAVPGLTVATTKGAALAALVDHLKANPEDRGRLQVVPEYELVETP